MLDYRWSHNPPTYRRTVTPNWYRSRTVPKFGLQSSWITGACHYTCRYTWVPLGPTLANVFMCHVENIWVEICPSHFKPIIYRRFLDDTFSLFRSKDHVEKFRNYLNKQHKNKKFTSEIEENGSLSFLDIKISRENNKFLTSVYRKPTFSGVFTNFESFIFLKVNWNFTSQEFPIMLQLWEL